MNIRPGDVVVCIKKPGQDPKGRPVEIPVVKKTYRVVHVYRECYGLGVSLAGMNPHPYQGYFLFVDEDCAAQCFGKPVEGGWYFKKVQAADAEFTAQMRAIKPKSTTKGGSTPAKTKEKAK